MDSLLRLNGLYLVNYIEIFDKIISFFFISIIDVKTFEVIFKVEIDKMSKVKLILYMYFFKTINVILIPSPYYIIANLIIVVILFKIMLKENVEKCILGEAINATIVIVGKAIISKYIMYTNIYFNTNGYSNLYNHLCNFFISFFICSWKILIYYVIKRFKFFIKLSDDLSKKNRISIIIISIIVCLIINYNVAEMTVFKYGTPYIIFMLDIVALVICFYIGIRDVVRIDELEKKETRIQCLQNYNNTLSIMYDSMRAFKHDFSNFVQALYGYASTENIEGIKNMANSIFEDCKSVNNMEVLDPKVINNPAIYSIVTNKYYLAKKQNINMNVEVMINLNEMNVSIYDLCKIIGILLDNAIEAARECEEKIINVRFIKDNTCDRKLIIIENTYKKVDIDIDKIFEKGYSTKTDNNNEHGLGLWTVKKILQQSKNLSLFTKKEKLFRQQLEIY